MTYKKLIIITSRFPYPLEKGDKLRAYEQIKLLSESFEIYLLCTSDRKIKEEYKKELQPYCKEIHLFPISKWQIISGLFLHIFSNTPFQVAYFHHFSIQNKINKILKRINPDHIYCQLIRASEYVKNYHKCPKTLDYMDALSKGMERRAKTAKHLYKYIFQLEHKRLLNYENSIFNYFEYKTIISEQDKEYIPHKNKNDIYIVPNGVNPSFFQYPTTKKKEVDIIFIGNMAYVPNIKAAKFIVHKILPLLPKDKKIKIAGSSPTKEVLRLTSSQVEVTGYIENIKEVYASAKIFVAPMFIGTGLQNKLLEAMALGIPCITTELANNALKAIPNEDILIAHSEKEFAEQIQLLLNTPDLLQKIASSGQDYVLKNYNWKNVSLSLINLLQK